MAAVKRSISSPAVGPVPASSPAGSAVAVTSQQLFDRCLDIDRQLRASLRKKSFYDVEIRQLKQQLKDLYENLIFKDYGHAQNHDVEQLLWKSVFYNSIEGFRQRIQTASKAGDSARDALKKVTAAYLKFLDDARLFYKELLFKLQQVYGDVGVSVDLESVPRIPKASGSQGGFDCRVSVHRCLIYLGDISRYKAQLVRCNRTDWQSASKYYQQAGRVHPRSGNPYNQLGVIAFYLKDELRAVYYYFRSLSVSTPFLTARENLKLLFEKNRSRYSAVVQKSAGRQSKNHTSADAKQALCAISSDLSTCFVRLSGIMFDHINTEQFSEARVLAVGFLKELLASKAVMELIAALPAADNILLHLLVLAVFSVYNTEGQASRPASIQGNMDVRQLNRYHHQAVTVAFQYATCVIEAAACDVHALLHVPLGAVTFLTLNWILAQPQLVMRQYDKALQQDEVLAQTSFWKALCQLTLRFGEAVKKEKLIFNKKSPGLLPEEVEFRGFEPFRVTAADVPSEASVEGNTAQLRMVRCIQCCRAVSDMMQHHLASVVAPDSAASDSLRVSGTATLSQYMACNSAIQTFCNYVNMLYNNQIPSAQAAGNQAHAKQGLSESVSIGAASSVEPGSSPMNTATSASALLEPQSGSSDFRTFSSGADAPPLLEDLPPLDLLAVNAPFGRQHFEHAGVGSNNVLDAAHGNDADLDEDEEVIVFQPQNISRPPSRAPEVPSGTLSAGGSGISRVASIASFPVSPTIAAHQEFNLFASDASLALHKLVTSGGVHPEQQLSMDSIRSEVSGGVAGRDLASSTPRAQVASPSTSLKVSPAAGSLPEPPAEWTALLQPLSAGSRPNLVKAWDSKDNPISKHPPLFQPSPMPPPPPTSLQLAAMAGVGVSSSFGYGFGAIGAQRGMAASTLNGPMMQASTQAPTGLRLLQPDEVASSMGHLVNPNPGAMATPSQQSPTLLNSSNQLSPTTSQPVQTITESASSNSLATLLQKLQRRPVHGQSSCQLQTTSGQPTSGTYTGATSTLPPQPPSPSLRAMCPSPQQQLISINLQPPSRLSLGSSEQMQPLHVPTASPSSLAQGNFGNLTPAPGVHWAASNAPPASLNAIAPVMPLPGFGDVLTLTQLEQVTLAAHEESVANDQAEATAIAAAGQLLDEQAPGVHPVVAAPSASLSAALPPMPSEKFLATPAQQAQAVAAPQLPDKLLSVPVQPAVSVGPAPAAMHPPAPPTPSLLLQQIHHTGNSNQPSFLSHMTRGPSYSHVHSTLPQHSQQLHPPGHSSSIQPFNSQVFNPVDAVGSSVTMPARSGSTIVVSGHDISQAFSAAAAPHNNFPQTRVARIPDREVPNAGFSFLDILEAHHTQGGDYSNAAHLYNPPAPEPVAASFPMLLSTGAIGYRTAEPLPQ